MRGVEFVRRYEMRVSTPWRLATGLALATALVTVACGGGTPASSRGPAPPAAPANPPANTGGASGAASSGTSPAPAALQARSAYTTISAAAAPWWIALDGGYFREQ